MNRENYFVLGHIAKLHGYKGEVSLFLDTTHPEDYTNLTSVFVEIDNSLIPFFIQSFTLNKKKFAKVKFEGVNSEEEAAALLRKQIYLPLEKLPQLSEQNFYDHEIIGFTVIDKNFGTVGKVIQVIDFEQNPLLQIKSVNEEKEVLLPLANHLVKRVNREKKELNVEAPPGLIELYLES